MSAERVIAVARGELGYTEYPAGSNRTKYWEEYDKAFQGQPWCVAFLWWCFRQAGESAAFFGGGKTASCSMLLRWYQEQGQTVPVNNVQVGDILILNFSGKRVDGELDTEHCGIVVDMPITEPYGYVNIMTVEGNTTPGEERTKQSNGGCVALKVRYPSQIVGVCRPQYKEDDVPKIDYEGHWAQQHIQWAIDAGIATGYQDGSFQPDKPITRAEVVTMLHRMDAKIRRDFPLGGEE